MGVPTTQNCCFCLSLRTGVIIIAVLLCIGGVGLFGKAGGSTSLIIQGVLVLATGIIMLIGVLTRKPALLLLSLVLYVLNGIFQILEPFIMKDNYRRKVAMANQHGVYEDPSTVSLVFYCLLYIVFLCYVSLVIFSHYKALKN